MLLTAQEDAAWARVVEAAKKEGKVTLYSFNFTGDTGLNIMKVFKERYGITVDIITGRGAEFLERLKTEKRVGQLTADFTEGSAIHVKNMANDGITIGVSTELPALKEKGVWIVDPLSLDPQNKHLVSHFVTTYSPWINTKTVKPGEEPKVWRDLLKPRWKGRMTLTEYKLSGGPYLLFPPLLREKVIDVVYIKALFGQDMLFISSVMEEASRIAQGERDLMIRGSDSQATFVMQGAPLRAIELEDGTTLSPGTATVIAGAPHPNAARLFLNWIITPEGQAAFGKYKGIGLVRKDATDYRPEPIKFIPKRPIVMTFEDNDDGSRLFREKWLDKLWGR